MQVLCLNYCKCLELHFYSSLMQALCLNNNSAYDSLTIATYGVLQMCLLTYLLNNNNNTQLVTDPMSAQYESNRRCG